MVFGMMVKGSMTISPPIIMHSISYTLLSNLFPFVTVSANFFPSLILSQSIPNFFHKFFLIHIIGQIIPFHFLTKISSRFFQKFLPRFFSFLPIVSSISSFRSLHNFFSIPFQEFLVLFFLSFL